MRATATTGVLVLAEPTASGRQAAWRGAVVARELALPLCLLYARQVAAGPDAGESAVRQLAADIEDHLGLQVHLELAGGDALAAAVRAARRAALLVIGSQRGNPLREFVLGTQAERLIRLCRVPVLVVKRPPQGAYRRVLVPVVLSPAARTVIAAATRLSRDPRMEVLHALHPGDELGMRACELPEAVVRRERLRAADRARSRLQALLGEAAARPDAAVVAVAFGDAASLVLAREQAMRADLVVIGKRRRALLADFLLGSVTRRVLAAARADVLVLPAQGRDTAGWTAVPLAPGPVT